MADRCEIASLLSARQHGGCKHILPRFKPDQDGDDDAESSMAWAQLALTWPAAVAANGTPSVPVTAITRKCRIIYIIEITCVFVFIAPTIPALNWIGKIMGRLARGRGKLSERRTTTTRAGAWRTAWGLCLRGNGCPSAADPHRIPTAV